ncbi:hypothetical protein P4O66_009975, partial [Electrophorus voltai]
CGMGEQSDMSFKTTGSTWLSPLSDLVGIPLDQVNFIICQVFGLVIAFWFRLCLHPQRAGPALRHAVATLLGASLVIFCFGWLRSRFTQHKKATRRTCLPSRLLHLPTCLTRAQPETRQLGLGTPLTRSLSRRYAFHIFILTLACYVILCQVSACTVHWYSLIVALGYLTACQVSRVFIFNYGILSTDFSGPLMMITQKITTVAFQVHDGMGRKQDDLTPEQRRLAVTYVHYTLFHFYMETAVVRYVNTWKRVAFPSDSARPSLLEYLSYNLNFLSILVGPCSNYHDYIDFIEGRHVWRKLERLRQGSDLEHDGYVSLPEPSPVRAVCQKLLVCVGCVVWFFVVTRSFPIVHNVDPQFVSQTPFLSRLAYAFVSIQAARPKFYFAWTLADAIHNAAGYGISGMDDKGRVSWDLVSNIHIWEIEASPPSVGISENSSYRVPASLGISLCLLANRRERVLFVGDVTRNYTCYTVCYDRAPHYRTPLTFVLSALWHGVYPGYYFTFLTGIPITLAARAVRRNLRPYFLGSRSVKLAYDVVTWTATQFTVCYAVMPFLLLAVEPTLTYYRQAPSSPRPPLRSMYFHVHVISILAVILLPSRPRIVKPGNHVLLSNNNVKAE